MTTADGDWLVLFVVLDGDGALTDEFVAQAPPRHVPDDVIAVPAIPHARTGKKLEVPVKRLIQGHPLDQVAARPVRRLRRRSSLLIRSD
ncbi:hypothetical protein [Dactylosporangium sp. NPDC000521]|uniref:hypothetical protein n=1 Tax=Dactylosporangium sp. NPDC000521 TaxID=3363975 RepID=UPI00368F5642